MPDAKTVWLIRGRLKVLNLADDLFAGFYLQLGFHANQING